MKRAIATKFIAYFLTVTALVTAAIGAMGIALLESNGLYVSSLGDQQAEWYDKAGQHIALEYATRFAAKRLGQCNELLVKKLYGEDDYFGMDSNHWQIEVWQEGERIDQTYQIIDDPIAREYTFKVEYPVAVPVAPIGDVESETDEEHPKPLYVYDRTIMEDGELVKYRLSYYESPTYTVKIWMSPDVTSGTPDATLASMYPHRFAFIGILVLGLLLFAAGLVYLLWAAGVTAEGKLSPVGLNMLPLDLYAGSVAAGATLYIWVLRNLSAWSNQDGFSPAILTILFVATFACSLLITGFLTAIAAQIKLRKGYWWKHSALFFCGRYLYRGLRACYGGVCSVYRMLPVLWQWLAVVFAAVLGVSVFSLLALVTQGLGKDIFLILLVASLVGSLAIALYGGYAFGKLLTGARRMAAGDLDHQINMKYLSGSFLDFAKELNSLSEIAVHAAKQQMKAERMKTELITNVSHDIKTPLTSIINFVDLLQKPHNQEQEEQYLEILSRQSGRMKKLIDDLIALSKASTGNLAVSISQIDAVEAVNQALGEFSDKLKAVPLEPVFRQPEEPVFMRADGKLCWRVLSNLFSNAVKYAMPNTRLFIDLLTEEDKVIISLKNVSREPLVMAPEELMERFVQGDISRNSEGSGLGLNIAHSLMELQKGQLELTLDGDLFKVTLTYPSANCS